MLGNLGFDPLGVGNGFDCVGSCVAWLVTRAAALCACACLGTGGAAAWGWSSPFYCKFQ